MQPVFISYPSVPDAGAAGAASVDEVSHAERVRSAQLVRGIYKLLPLVFVAVFVGGVEDVVGGGICRFGKAVNCGTDLRLG